MSDSKKGSCEKHKKLFSSKKFSVFLDQNSTNDSNATQTTTTTTAASKPTNKIELGLLEEDDEFEEFETEDWQQDEKESADQKDVNLWEDNWDDDNIEDDFTIQLRLKFFIF
jgi:26 proteasome complex subunit DSS1